MEDLVRDLRFAARMLLRKPAFTVIAVLSLAIGIGANTAIYSLVDQLFLRPLPIAEPERVMTILTADERLGGTGPLSHLNWKDLREQNDTFAQIAGYDFNGIAVSTGGEPAIQLGLLVSGNYFDTLGVEPRLGRFFGPEEDTTPGAHPVAVLGHVYWNEELGGDPSVPGRQINLNGRPFTVIGVAPPGFNGLNVGIEPALYVPMAMNGAIRSDPALNWYDERRGLFVNAFGRLAPGVERETALANLQLIAERLEREYPDDNEGRGLTLQPVSETTLFNRDAATAGAALLMAAVGVVLLIACANVANLLLARATERRKEIAVRLAMGISRGRLVRQLLTESVLVSLLGGALGLATAWLSRDLLAGMLGTLPGAGFNLAVRMSLDPSVLIFTLSLALLTGLLFGLVPAIQSSRPGLVSAIKDQTDLALARGRQLNARNFLVVAQLALSLVALIGAGLFIRSLQAARDIDLGYDTDQAIVLGFDVGLLGYSEEEGRQFFRQARERIAAVPGVTRTTLAQGGPLQGTLLRSVLLEGENPEERTYVQVNGVAPGYFETLGIALEEGRPFDDGDRTGGVPVVVVNREMAEKYWPGRSALGQRFRFFGMEPVEVVGIAETVKYNNPGEDPQPYAYLPLDQYYVNTLNVVAQTVGDPGAVLLAARRELQAMDPDLVINATTGASLTDDALSGQANTATLLGAFGAIALSLAAVGIYGVMSYAVRRRRREIGIRMALGAGSTSILGMVLRQGLALTAIGLGVGVAASLAVTRALRQLLFVSPTDPTAFLVTGGALLAVALVACLVPAWRAARLSPVRVLREG
ncbi:MAG TPA: ABC transporter permease [Thermoanaerobaculia bacterium]|nr:ABC transporter permease [Thermoanaerobaculia bacterium]